MGIYSRLNDDDFGIIGVLDDERFDSGLPQRLEKRRLLGCGGVAEAFG